MENFELDNQSSPNKISGQPADKAALEDKLKMLKLIIGQSSTLSYTAAGLSNEVFYEGFVADGNNQPECYTLAIHLAGCTQEQIDAVGKAQTILRDAFSHPRHVSWLHR